MAKYHFNRDTGKTGLCKAQVQCRLGLTESEHFETREEAQKAFEETQNLSTVVKKQKASTSQNLSGVNVDLSGISQENRKKLVSAWNKHYELLNKVEKGEIEEPLDVSPDDYLVESSYVMRPRGTFFEKIDDLVKEEPYNVSKDSFHPDSEYVVIVSARQGGGNRECYCEDYDSHEDGCLALNNEITSEHPNYVTDYDDDFDSTYNYFVFDNKITKEQFDKYHSDYEKNKNYTHLKNERSLIEDGKAPAWFINNVEDYRKNMDKYRDSKQSYENAIQRVKNDKEIADAAGAILSKLENKDFDNISLEEVQKFNSYNKRYSKYDLDKVKDAHRKIREYEVLENAYKEAELLEDGSALKEYLLADRGTASYNATEKKGRRNVTVKRTYERGSVLGHELKSNKYLLESGSRDLEDFAKPFKMIENSYENNFNSVAIYRNKIEEERRKVWESGWVYDEPAPKMPKNFLAVN